jgi:hypothetical protein
MERNLLEREIDALLESTGFLSGLSGRTFSDAEVKMFPEGLFFGFIKENSFLRKEDLKTKQKFNGKELFYPNKGQVDILGENGDWLFVAGNASYKENGIEFIYSEKSVTVKVKGWIKKDWVTIKQTGKPRTIGFEFDIHFGFMDEIAANAGLTIPPDKTKLTTHENTTDGFVVKLDGPRFEAATKPFTVEDTGLKELKETIKNLKTFTTELQKGCQGGTAQKVTGVAGNARVFSYSKMVSSLAGFPMSKLPVSKKFSSNCSVWASPQATVAIPLSKVAPLVELIKRSEGKASGIALTGDSSQRMGLRSEALYKAKFQVDKLHQEITSKNPKIKLSNSKEVDATIFSESLRGFLILLVSYLWTSELPYHFTEPSPRDYEPFAKAFLPINVKAPFPDIFDKLLTDDEKLFFKEQFAKDENVRVNLYRLVKPGAVKADGKNKLFPKGRIELGKDSVHARQELEFGVVPTWSDLIEHTLDSSHNGWGSKLIVPLSNQIGLNKTAPNVALELRRVGFRAMFDYDWKRFMENVFNLIKNI